MAGFEKSVVLSDIGAMFRNLLRLYRSSRDTVDIGDFATKKTSDCQEIDKNY